MEPLSQIPQISTDLETEGFDLSSGKTWIYPENYPIRQYQFHIVQSALYANTLVCLPTGLGKTFIAAVVMYNFSRWYPRGKVIFLAPTRPLVAQQIHACHHIMGIPSTETVELTGATNQKNREAAWLQKRVIFATPQVFHNDLERNIVPAGLIKCIVIDEAHKALGKHSYCECIRLMSEKSQYFRILALSATPGNKIDNVHEIVQNLHIAHMELRDESSTDIKPYINERKIDILLVPLSDELAQFKERYIFIMDHHVKVLRQYNVLSGQTANISKGRVFHLVKEYQKKTNKSGSHGQIMKTLTILMTMYHAYEVMVRVGLRAFHKFYENHSDKFWMSSEDALQTLLEDIGVYLGPFPDVKTLEAESIPESFPNLVFGHTKFQKLKELLLHHFSSEKEKESDTRAIVFVEYRDIVNEIYVLLMQSRPLIRPQMFVGQAGQKQKQQIKALENFRTNHVNVLISTSIGEEGLDVGEVDLIICFDISQSSPTRLVQRMGRTGRKRDGHIIILVTDGKEHETLRYTMARRDSINNKILNTSNIFSSFYQNNPRMIPEIFEPECFKIFINVQLKTPTAKVKEKKKREKKINKKQKVESTIARNFAAEFSATPPNEGAQFSKSKFFCPKKSNAPIFSNFRIQCSRSTQCNDIGKAIKPCDVKLLSRDDEAHEFLLACALKKSEKDANSKPSANIDYVPSVSTESFFFNFTVPDIKILECLATLSDSQNLEISPKHLSFSEENVSCTDINTHAFTDFDYVFGESKFEDLLDESSKSDDNRPVESDETNFDTDVGFSQIPETFFSPYPVESDSPKLSRINETKFEDFQTGNFEDILNDSSDSLESNVGSVDFDRGVDELFASEENAEDEIAKKESAITLKNDSQSEDHSTKDLEFMGEKMFTITQALEEIANAKGIDVESEDDMFRDETPEIENELDNIDLSDDFVEGGSNKENFIAKEKSRNVAKSIVSGQSNSSRKLNDSNVIGEELESDFEWDEERDNTDNNSIKKNSNSNEQNNVKTIEKDLSIDDIPWDDDFQLPVEPAPSPVTCPKNYNSSYNTPKISKVKSLSLKRPKNNLEKQSSNDNAWISVRTSSTISKQSPLSLAKKLANASNASISTPKPCLKKLHDDSDDSGDEFAVDAKSIETTESETSFFFNVPKNPPAKKRLNEPSTSNTNCHGILSENKHKASERLSFYDFKAPGKYLGKSNKDDKSKRKIEKVSSSNANANREETRRKQTKSEFICYEAEVSSNDSTDEASGTDEDLADFVSYTQNLHDDTDMQIHYLQSIKSPVKKRAGTFHFRNLRPVSPDEIYSQPVSQENETYLEDSFCVKEEDEDKDEDKDETSRAEHSCVLEKAERELARRKRKRARSKEDYVEDKPKRNKRINILNHSSSSEDETERLRKQIQEESI